MNKGPFLLPLFISLSLFVRCDGEECIDFYNFEEFSMGNITIQVQSPLNITILRDGYPLLQGEPSNFFNVRVGEEEWMSAGYIYCIEDGGEEVIIRAYLEGEENSVQLKLIKLSPDNIRAEFEFKGIEPLEIKLSFLIDEAEHFIGFGELYDSIDSRGKRRDMYIDLDSDSESGLNDVHVAVPFYISSKRYGVFYEMFEPGYFDMGKEESNSQRTVFYAPRIEFIFFGKTEPLDILADYLELTGLPIIPPEWAFLPMVWRGVYESQDRVLHDIQRMEEEDIPCGALWIDSPWETAYNDFNFNPVQFPDPQYMIDEIHDRGIKLILWTTPYMNYSDDSDEMEGMAHGTGGLYEEGEENGYFVKWESGETYTFPWSKGDGAAVDLTNPNAIEWWGELQGNVLDMGVDGWKLDGGEHIPGVFLGIPFSEFETGLSFYDGRDEMTMHSLYKNLYNKTYTERIREDRGEDYFTIGRTATFGGQSMVSAIWPGDLETDFSTHEEGNTGGLPSAIIAMLTLSASGFPFYGSDIGGYSGDSPSEDLFIRWIQFGTFSGIMQTGGGHSLLPWDNDYFSTTLLSIYREFATLRKEMVAYIYSIISENPKRPLVKPLPLVYIEDEDAWDSNYEYLFGEDILVAPVTNPEGKVDVYFPEGNWVDFFTGEIYEGSETYSLTFPIEKFPLYLKEGSIFPLRKDNGWDVHLYPAVSGSLRMNSGIEFSYIFDGSSGEFFVKDSDSSPVHLKVHCREKGNRGSTFERSYLLEGPGGVKFRCR